MQDRVSSENHIINNIKVILDLAGFLGPRLQFLPQDLFTRMNENPNKCGIFCSLIFSISSFSLSSENSLEILPFSISSFSLSSENSLEILPSSLGHLEHIR
jgi:hypothetical protein